MQTEPRHALGAFVHQPDTLGWAVDHEYRYAQLRDRLGIDVTGRIHSYVYPDESVRASLTGARFTSVAPVWLREPQVHVLADQIGNVFPHELAHVFSREFGMPVVRASISVGLVEGLAVATEPPDGRPSPHELVAASALFRDSTDEEFAERMAATLSAGGFWSGRGAVSYTVSGSFVTYLLDNYGVESFREAYPYGSFQPVYGKSSFELALEWVDFLASVPAIERSAAWRADLTFSIPSLFERSCPHWEPPEIRRAERAARLFDEGLLIQALEAYEDLLSGKLVSEDDAYLPGRIGWGRTMLALGRIEPVVDTLRSMPRETLSLAGTALLADAFALSGEPDSARTLYEWVRIQYPLYAREARAVWALRKITAVYPDLVDVLVSADTIQVRRERLASVLVEREIETSRVAVPGLLWQAMLAAEDREWSDALASVERTFSIPGGPCAIGSDANIALRCSVWAAVYAYRAGDIDRSLAYAKSAIDDFAAVGDLAEARVLLDFQSKLRWLEKNQSVVYR